MDALLRKLAVALIRNTRPFPARRRPVTRPTLDCDVLESRQLMATGFMPWMSGSMASRGPGSANVSSPFPDQARAMAWDHQGLGNWADPASATPPMPSMTPGSPTDSASTTAPASVSTTSVSTTPASTTTPTTPTAGATTLVPTTPASTTTPTTPTTGATTLVSTTSVNSTPVADSGSPTTSAPPGLGQPNSMSWSPMASGFGQGMPSMPSMMTTATPTASSMASTATTTAATTSASAPSSTTSTPPALSTQATTDLETLKTDTQAIQDGSGVTIGQLSTFQQDEEALKKDATTAPSQAAVTALQTDLKALQGTLPTAAQTTQLETDDANLLTSEGITDTTLIQKAISDQVAIAAASNVTQAELDAVTADQKAVATDLGITVPSTTTSTTSTTNTSTTTTPAPGDPTMPGGGMGADDVDILGGLTGGALGGPTGGSIGGGGPGFGGPRGGGLGF